MAPASKKEEDFITKGKKFKPENIVVLDRAGLTCADVLVGIWLF